MRALQPLRCLARRLFKSDRPFILMYHRVAHLTSDPWDLAVRPDRFAEQVEALVKIRTVVPLGWLVAELKKGRMRKGTAAVTFDDGYAEVLTAAKPVLERHGCPATIFITTGAIGSRKNFWWDELARIILESPVLPPTIEIEIADQTHRWRLSGVGDSRPAEADAPTMSRDQSYRMLWGLLRPLDPLTREQHIETIAAWAGAEIDVKPQHPALTEVELRELASPGFIDIGAHTVTHPSLPLLNETLRRGEIQQSRQACEDILGQPIDGFAYPFGDLDDATVAFAISEGFAFACSTEPSSVTTRSDAMRLPRLAVADWTGETFLRWLGHEGNAP